MKFSKKVLKNGLRLVTVPMADNPTVTVLVLVEAGSKYETKKINGLSHFLEHMCFKGTEKRPRAIDISKELDALGSQYNAFTSQEYTGYYAKSGSLHFEQVFDVVSDVYLNSTFPEAEIEKEKGVIIEEINMYEDLPHIHVRDLLMNLLYGDQPAGWNVLGEKKNILNMKRGDFLKYKTEHYTPEKTTVVVVGQIDEKKVLSDVKRVFGKLKKGKNLKKKRVHEKQNKSAVLIKNKKTDQTHFVVGVRSLPMGHKDGPVLAVLGGVLGGGMSSRLFQKLREEMGVGYYVSAYNDAYTDHGFFGVRAGVDNKRIFEVVEVVLREIEKIRDFEVDNEELNKVKEFLIGNMKLSLESTDDIANFFGSQELLLGEIKNIEEKAERIRKVTAKDIKRIARKIFKEEKLNLCLIGPFDPERDRDKFQKILKLF